MAPRTENDTLETVVEACRSSRAACDSYLEWLSRQDERERQPPFDMLRCVALLSLIADRLDGDGERPIGLIDTTIDLARELPEDVFGCAAACHAAADELSEWLNSAYARP